MPDPFTRSQAPSFVAPVTPPGREAEVTFISGVTADAKVAATSFGAWFAIEPPSNPAQYNPYYSKTTKLGDPTLQLAGTPAVVTYQFGTDPNWSDDERRLGRGVGAVVGGSRDHVHARDRTDCRSYPL